MKTNLLFPMVLLGLVCCLPACEDDKITSFVQYYTPEEYQVLSASVNLPSVPHAYGDKIFEDNQRNALGTLGRVLFYDVNLSSDNSVSCASCHKQQLAFSDDVPFSTGIQNRTTARNSIALGVFKSFQSYSEDPTTTLFWDGRVNNLHDQMIQTIANPNEMGMEMDEVREKIKNFDYYKILTQKAFQTDRLDETMVLFALETFMNSIQSQSSKFDGVAGRNPVLVTNWQGFNPQENLGKNLFNTNCVSCHSQALDAVVNFSKPEVHRANNGLDLVYTDKGAGEFDHTPGALAIFKVPSLRNIELTAPYMHDGRFATLIDVIDFYSENIQDHQNLHPELKENGHPKKFNFTANEKDALVQFLKTLTDHNLTNEPKWSDPFL